MIRFPATHLPEAATACGPLKSLWLRLACSTLILGGLSIGAAQAQTKENCAEPFCADGGSYSKAVGANTESETAADAPAAGGSGFSISVDGERVAGDAPTPVDAERKTDVSLEEVDIQVKFDGLDQRPLLNVATSDVRRTYKAGDTVEFLATSNYPDWISKREVLIYPRRSRNLGKIVPIAVPVGEGGIATWTMPDTDIDGGTGEFDYVLRVYDGEGRFDETVPLSLARTDRDDLEGHTKDSQLPPVSPGNGEDRTALRNIPVYGGAVTVFGRNVPPGYEVSALGETVPLDKENSFVIQRILPPGDHTVDVAVSGASKSGGLNFSREVNIPTNDWFYVGLADLTVGHRTGDDGIEDVKDGEFDKTYSKGRLAFYLKGKIKGRYLLTASADTREDKVSNLFRGLDAKDPRNFLSRIDPDDYYPVYGDDSTAIEDAPTRGKFYVRLERGESRVMWGNFKANVSGSKFLRNERALYGASGVYKTESKTSFGESRFEAEAYAANAETLAQRDVLEGTGGSAYFLSKQDITVGSETVSIQVRDPKSGYIDRKNTKQLTAGVDYEIDHLQGVIMLKRPLSSIALQDGATQTNDPDKNYLVVQYEYTPTAGDIDGYAFGGRAQGWVNDNIRVGVTGMKENTNTSDALPGQDVDIDHRMMGADVVVRHSDTTYLEAEIAQTEGRGAGRSFSNDGGFWLRPDQGDASKMKDSGRAYSLKGQVDLADISKGQLTGTVGGFYERMENGFSTLDHDIDATQRVVGGFANLQLADQWTLTGEYEDYADADGEKKREGTADLEYQIDEYWKVAFGVRHVGIWDVRRDNQDKDDPADDDDWNGDRTDLGARVTYAPDDDTSVYVFGQGTVAKNGNIERNDRIGVGGETRLTDRVSVGGEVSYGTSGWGALAAISYEPVTDRSYYAGYRLSPEAEFNINRFSSSSENDSGFVFGARHRYGDTVSAFAENNTDMFGRDRSLTTTYGVTYTPDTLWTITGGLEAGRVQDEDEPDFDRIAPSVAVTYKDEDKLAASLKLEARFEDSDDSKLAADERSRDQTSYYIAGGVAVKTSEDWRLLTNLDAVLSSSNEESVRDGDYIEASVGAAYRPVENDRLNALFKYVFLYDLPAENQVSAISGTEYGPKQRSHILSVDANYDLNQYLTVGAKYGFRIGETTPVDNPDTLVDESKQGFSDSSAHLAVLRADFHVVRNWDLLAEGRVLYSPTSDTTDWGALAAVYRSFGDNVKVGVGYNFGIFSDDLRDLTLDDQGVFMNVIGKF